MDFLNQIPKAQEINKNRQVGFRQTKQFLHSKGNSEQSNEMTTEWENIFTNHVLDQVVSRSYKELKQLSGK